MSASVPESPRRPESAELVDILSAVAEHGSINKAAAALGIARSTAQRAMKRAAGISVPRPTCADEPIDRVIARLASQSRRTRAAADADRWAPIIVRDNKPIGILWFGDPHLGTSTDWDALQRDVSLCASTDGLYGANIGDTTNNWTGRLARLYAEEDISRRTEWRLADWLLTKCGVTWLAWIMGNHDAWEHGAELMRRMDIHNRVTMHDWVARLELQFPRGAKVRVHAAHDFPGHSMWNQTHAASRAAQMLSDADLYVCGHKHTWGIQQFEMPERQRTVTVCRAKGYKTGDTYARRLGYPEARHGASILTIIDPTAVGPARVQAFADPVLGARVLNVMRSK